MRNGWYIDDEDGKIEQEMYEDDEEKGVRPKGMKKILQERGLWTDGMKKDDMVALLKKQQDFMDDEHITQIRLTVYKYNPYAKVTYLPKYHCELNGIESYVVFPSIYQHFNTYKHTQTILYIHRFLG